jgi:hypothetical protein
MLKKEIKKFKTKICVKLEYDKYYAGETIRGVIQVYGYPKDSTVNEMPKIYLNWKFYQTAVMHTVVSGFNTDFQCRRFFFNINKKVPIELMAGSEDDMLTTEIMDFATLPTCMPFQNKGYGGDLENFEYYVKVKKNIVKKKYQLNVNLSQPKSVLNLGSLLGQIKLKIKIPIFPRPIYSLLKDQKLKRIIHKDMQEKHRGYKFSCEFFKKVYQVEEQIPFRLRYDPEGAPKVTLITVKLERKITLSCYNRSSKYNFDQNRKTHKVRKI